MNEQNNTESNASLLQAKIDKLGSRRKSSGRGALYSIAGLLVGFGLCSGGLYPFGLVILAIAALGFFGSIVDAFVASSQLSHFEKQQRSGETMSEPSGLSKFGNAILAIILGFLALALIGYGLCVAIISIGNF